jgi:hypothetical protein
MREIHLVNIIKTLEPDVKEVEMDKEVIEIKCFSKLCSLCGSNPKRFKNPLYYKINDITLDKRRSFSISNFKAILSKTYNISLDYRL